MQLSADLHCECLYLKTEARHLVHKPEKFRWGKVFAEHCLGLSWHNSSCAAAVGAAPAPAVVLPKHQPGDCRECAAFPAG